MPAAARHRIPSWRFDGDSAAPEPQSKRINSHKKSNFGRNGIAQPDRRLDRRIITRQVFAPHDLPFDKATHYGTEPRMNNQLGQDEHWKGNKKSGLNLNVMKKRKPAGAAGSRGKNVEEQHRKPRD